MLPIPRSEWRNAEVLASWVELSALAADDAFASRGDVLEALHDSNLFTEKRTVGGEPRDSAIEGSSAAMQAEIWKVLQKRSRMLGAAWPFLLTDDALGRREGRKKLGEIVSYATMLLLEAATNGWYDFLKISPKEDVRTNFELIVAASLTRLCGGRAIRFGAPFPKAWPKTFHGRIKQVTDFLGVQARETEIKQLASAGQQDGSVDVIASWKIGDEGAGNPYLLVQCATGKKWLTDKTGQPMMDLWDKWVNWNGPQFKVVAVPFALRDGCLERAWIMHDSAIVLDRLRIYCGEPDQGIDDVLRNALSSWCEMKFKVLSSKAA